MKKVKKVVAFALVAAMLLGVTGCGQDKKTDKWEKAKQAAKNFTDRQNTNTSSSASSGTSSSSTSSSSSGSSTNRFTNSSSSNSNKNTSSGTNSISASSNQSTGTRLPLDTTKNFQGLRLKRLSDRNDLIALDFKKGNNLSRLTGSEPAFKVAVDTFNEVSRKDNKFVAYKVVEYHPFNENDKEFKALTKQSQYKGATDYCRFTFEIYQYEKSAAAAKYDQYTDYSYDPHYLRVTVCQVNGRYQRVTYMTSR